MRENNVQPGSPQMTILRVRTACWKTGYRHTLRIRNTYCFYTATLVTRTRFSITIYVYCLSRQHYA